ncbi:efflux RND transporter periplasmic adaptor subunit [Endozoicomonas numazuensis]|uniref:efflux RND transporter periplasmic adaptor subunit n=1 Tax=Endozoicomonas numazuensis TaxID=1137799 RepID=UPI0006904B49|nr:efflux RND transporter periplasmic adaptor subunit [Endozoicomonas numazuensis]
MAKNNALRQTVVSLAILAVCGGIAYGLSQWSKPPKKEQELAVDHLVEFQVMTPESLSFSVESQGVVRPSIETSLVAEVAGVVTEVSPLFVSGGVFNKGDVLARIDASDYRVAVRQAEATLAASQARLKEESAKSQAESKSWTRSGRSLADAPDLLLRKPFVEEASANVKAASAQLEKARRDLERTQIRAPYDGMVRDRSINLGQFVSMGTQAGSIFAIADAEVRLSLKPSDLTFINLPSAGDVVDEPIAVELSQSMGNRTLMWEASLDRVEGVVDEQSRMHYVVARVDDPYGLTSDDDRFPLKAGSFVYARILGSELEGLFNLPRSAVYSDGKVLVIDEDSSLSFRQIIPVYADADSVYFSQGLAEGDRVAVTPLANPVEGMRVRLNEPGSSVAGLDTPTDREG